MIKKKGLMPLAAITVVLFLAVIIRPNSEVTKKGGLGIRVTEYREDQDSTSFSN